MRPLPWILIPSEWCPYRRDLDTRAHSGDAEAQRKESPCEDSVRRKPSVNQGEGPEEEGKLQALSSWTSNL